MVHDIAPSLPNPWSILSACHDGCSHHINRSASKFTARTLVSASLARRSRSALPSLFSLRWLPRVKRSLSRFVEERYHVEIGTAQNTQLAKAIAAGEEKGDFVLPKGKSKCLSAAFIT
jgi:hypothetical protein